jgi:23S rRNA C2498 (ribose-2'-O)-methylase RlmM
MEEVRDSRHFQMSNAISTDMKACPGGWTSRMPHLLGGTTGS